LEACKCSIISVYTLGNNPITEVSSLVYSFTGGDDKNK